MRKVYILAVLVVFLAGFFISAARMEKLLATGTEALLPLAPVDPRALLMGDYMDLRYQANADIASALRSLSGVGGRGTVQPLPVRAVMRLEFLKDKTGVVFPGEPKQALFARFDDGSPLGPDEVFLTFKQRGNHVASAAPAFYFQEGHAEAYEVARFGRLRMSADGKTLLTALCDVKGNEIRPGAAQK